jgi:deazaflavin-dependent oxidoreductase (nitroreductase family)
VSVDSAVSKFNVVVAAILRSPFHWLLSFGLMLITVTGRRTGRRYTIPVGYQRHEDVLTILVSEAPKKQWWRNFHAPSPTEVRLKDKTLSGVAQVVAPTSPEFGARAEETLRRLPWMGKVFGIEYRRGERLDDEQIAALGRNIAIVQVALTPV